MTLVSEKVGKESDLWKVNARVIELTLRWAWEKQGIGGKIFIWAGKSGIFRQPDTDVTLHISVTIDTHPDIHDRRRGDTHTQDRLRARYKTEDETTHLDVSNPTAPTVGEV